MFFDPNITLVLRSLMPWAGEFFKLISQLGSEYFYIGLVLIGFWAVKKRAAILLTYVLLTGMVSNYLLKLAIANPRPDSSYWYPGVEETNYSTPSNHAQLSSTLYSWFSLKIKTWWILILSIVLTFLIGISRVYLGVHYLEDVLIGWSIGIITALILYYLEKPFADWLSKYRDEYLYLMLFLIGFGMTAALTYLTPLAPGDNFGSFGGIIMGTAIGLLLEKRLVNFSAELETRPNRNVLLRLILRCVIGLIFVIGLLVVLSPFMPTADVWLRALRYTIVAVSGFFVWPLIFTRLKL